MAKNTDIRYEDLVAQATDIGNGWREAEFELESGDTAFAPGTTKYILRAHGPAKVRYRIASEGGVEGYTEGKIGRSMI